MQRCGCVVGCRSRTYQAWPCFVLGIIISGVFHSVRLLQKLCTWGRCFFTTPCLSGVDAAAFLCRGPAAPAAPDVVCCTDGTKPGYVWLLLPFEGDPQQTLPCALTNRASPNTTSPLVCMHVHASQVSHIGKACTCMHARGLVMYGCQLSLT